MYAVWNMFEIQKQLVKFEVNSWKWKREKLEMKERGREMLLFRIILNFLIYQVLN